MITTTLVIFLVWMMVGTFWVELLEDIDKEATYMLTPLERVINTFLWPYILYVFLKNVANELEDMEKDVKPPTVEDRLQEMVTATNNYMSSALGVSKQVYIDTMNKCTDEEVEYITTSLMNVVTVTEENLEEIKIELDKAVKLFHTKIKPKPKYKGDETNNNPADNR